MSLTLRLRDDLKVAMKAKDENAKSAIRMALAAMKNAEIEKGSALTEADELAVIARQVKMSREAIAEFEGVGRPDAADAERLELDVLMRYLPEQLTEADIRTIVSDAIAQIGALGPRDMGKVMGSIMPKVRGRADGKLVNQVVKELLGE